MVLEPGRVKPGTSSQRVYDFGPKPVKCLAKQPVRILGPFSNGCMALVNRREALIDSSLPVPMLPEIGVEILIAFIHTEPLH
jgi:hypothetical protein